MQDRTCIIVAKVIRDDKADIKGRRSLKSVKLGLKSENAMDKSLYTPLFVKAASDESKYVVVHG